jgi:hypothetical protein
MAKGSGQGWGSRQVNQFLPVSSKLALVLRRKKMRNKKNNFDVCNGRAHIRQQCCHIFLINSGVEKINKI